MGGGCNGYPLAVVGQVRINAHFFKAATIPGSRVMPMLIDTGPFPCRAGWGQSQAKTARWQMASGCNVHSDMQNAIQNFPQHAIHKIRCGMFPQTSWSIFFSTGRRVLQQPDGAGDSHPRGPPEAVQISYFKHSPVFVTAFQSVAVFILSSHHIGRLVYLIYASLWKNQPFFHNAIRKVSKFRRKESGEKGIGLQCDLIHMLADRILKNRCQIGDVCA